MHLRVLAPLALLLLVPALAAADDDLGQCELTATGATSAHETMPGGRAAVLTDYWIGAAEKAEIDKQKGTTKAIVASLQLLTLNCQGKDIQLSIIPGTGASKTTIPFGPKTYKLVKGKGDVAVLGSVGGKFLVNPAGTIAITAFDGKHIAATIDLAAETMKHDAIKLTGKLDFACPGYSGCKK